MLSTVFQLPDVQGRGRRQFLGLFLDLVELPVKTCRLFNLCDQFRRFFRVAMKLLEDLLLPFLHPDAALLLFGQLDLCLTDKIRLVHANGHAGKDAVTHVIPVKPLLGIILVQRLCERLLERREMRSPIRRILSVDEGMELVIVSVRMREDDLHRLRLHAERLVKRSGLQLVLHKIRKPAGLLDLLSVQDELQPRIHIGIHAYAADDMFLLHCEFRQELRVWLPPNPRSPLVRRRTLATSLGDQHSRLELNLLKLAVADRSRLETG